MSSQRESASRDRKYGYRRPSSAAFLDRSRLRAAAAEEARAADARAAALSFCAACAGDAGGDAGGAPFGPRGLAARKPAVALRNSAAAPRNCSDVLGAAAAAADAPALGAIDRICSIISPAPYS